MTTPLAVRVDAALTDLYARAGIARPSERRPIAPVAALLGSHNLVCLEVPSLTSRAALQLLSRRGGLVDPPPAERENEPLAGYLFATPGHGTIFVCQDDLIERRRFSVAHELGHYLLHFWRLLNPTDPDDEPALFRAIDAFTMSQAESNLPNAQDTATSSDPADPLPPLATMEREANAFAAELLMPADLVRQLAADYGPRCKEGDLVWAVATRMLVSPKAMNVRLDNLDLLGTQGDEREARG